MDHDISLTNTPTPATEQTVGEQWVCVACEYPLKGLHPAGVCPECGTSIAISLRDDRLAHANPLWVMRLAQAATLSCFLSVAGWLLEFPLIFLHLVPQNSWILYATNQVHTFISPLVWLALWLLGTPEPVTGNSYRNRGWCWAIRIAGTLQLFRYLILSTMHPSPMIDLIFSFIPICVVTLAWMYKRQLARRIPDKALYTHAPFVLTALVLLDLLGYTIPYARVAFGVPLPLISPPAQRLANLVVLGYAIFILAGFSNRFTQATNEAMRNHLLDEQSPQ
ncbi:MAG TPA: hypothetical protein VHS31_06770 [Tepidisphaeraceae bacterium]|jgi:hypothetical protein|nr:hypothetical protein [Tepidisphaeraceae bacterium]